MTEKVDYTAKFPRFHTTAQIAGFLLALCDGDKTVGEVDFETFNIRLTDAKHPALIV